MSLIKMSQNAIVPHELFPLNELNVKIQWIREMFKLRVK